MATATIDFPPRQCLTCASSSDACDGGFPVCSSCKEKWRACKKPAIEVQVPWEKRPVTASTQSLNLQAQTPLTSDMAVFTEDYIISEHGALIRGITSVYGALKSMQYIDDAELMSPPYANFPVEQLTSIGLEPEAVALLRYLPYLAHPIEISFSSNSYSYLNNVDRAREVLWEGGNDLAPWAIRLSHCRAYPGLHGRTIIYDLRSKGIIQWASNERGYTNTYLDLPSTPSEDFFVQWVGYLRDLKEIPWRHRYGRQVLTEPPAGPSNYVDFTASGYTDPSEPVTVNSEQFDIDRFNTQEALKKLFMDHGWPDDFRGDEFKTARQRWQEEFNRLEMARDTAMQGGSPEAKARAFDECSKFLEESAGPAAVVKARND